LGETDSIDHLDWGLTDEGHRRWRRLNYTPELADEIARLQRLFGVDELVLTDPAEKRLKLVAGISQRIFARDGYSGHITFTTDLDRAVSDAAVVLLQLRIGGQAARAVDESLPLRCVAQRISKSGGVTRNRSKGSTVTAQLVVDGLGL
jgi:alpha-galactosidase/6-phospho-beta-glucosidase family protein